MLGARNISLSFDDHYQTRDTYLKELWVSEEFLDVTLVCDDGQIKAHKVILSAASPFFRQLFIQNPHIHPLLYLRGTSKKFIQFLLNFVYSGETSVKQEDLALFMDLASSLKIHGLAGEFSDKVEEDRKEPTQTGFINTEAIENDEKVFEIGRNTILEKQTDPSKTLDLISNVTDDAMIQVKEKVEEYSGEPNLELNTDEDEYEERMAELMMKVGDENWEWICKECPYRSRNKAHVKEHVQSHIHGFSLKCKYCEKSFKMKMYIRQHVRIYHKEMVRPVGRKSQVYSYNPQSII